MLYRTPSSETEQFKKRGTNAIEDVVLEILGAIDGVVLAGHTDGVVWRGQADIAWRLESSASRRGMDAAEVRAHETAAIKSAREIGMDAAQRMGDWEILARLRHHGAATRLIDCTSDPYIGLWFLCADSTGSSPESDGVLLAIDRSKFTEISEPWRQNSYKELHDRPEAALLYRTPPIDPRIAAQRGLFLLHSSPKGRSELPESELFTIEPPTASWAKDYKSKLDRLCGSEKKAKKRGRRQTRFPAVIGIVIPAEAKPKILSLLEKNFGFNEATIFPDFAGLSRHYEMPRS